MSKATVTITDSDGDELVLPAVFQVCSRCRGEGTHVNPSIDGNGLIAEDFADDPDFAEEYSRGTYDVPCSECHGERVVAQVDVEALTPAQRADWDAHLAAERDYQRDYASERRLRMAESGERY